MKPPVIFLVSLPPPARGVAAAAAQQAFPGSAILTVENLDEMERDERGAVPRLLVLTDPVAVAAATRALDAAGAPRWAMVVLGRYSSEVAETVPPEEWSPPLLARVFRSALLQHELLCENLRLRGDLKTVVRRISHDVRTPLGCIYTSAGVLPGLDPAALPGLSEIITQSTAEISQLIDRANFLLKASADPLAPAPVEMGGVVAAVLRELETAMTKTGGGFTQPAAWPEVSGVAPWLHVIWWNLLSNTLQHGGPAAQVRLTWTREPGEYRFSVTDQGPGVPPARLDALFAPFDRLHELKTGGLGLSIVQRLVALQGGRCDHERPARGGSCFSFTLPLPSATV